MAMKVKAATCSIRCSSLFFNSEEEVKMTAATLSGEDTSLASQCLALCQTLVSQGKAFTFSLKIDSNSTLSFSLDTKESKVRQRL